MFDTGTEKYRSDIKLGERYTDTQTGLTGVATALHFYQHACERVTLETLKTDGELMEGAFDAPRLRHVESGRVAETTRTGGPARAGETRTVAGR